MNTFKRHCKPLLALLAAGAVSLAHADVRSYDSQASFTAAMPNIVVDTFDDMLGPLASVASRKFGDFSYSVSTQPGSSLYGTGDGSDPYLSTNRPDDVLTFSAFSGNVRGFGGYFFATDLFGQYVADQSVSISVTSADGSVSTSLLHARPDGFIGFVASAAITEVTLRADGGVLWPTANNVVLASSVPEPAAPAMLLAGLAVLGSLSWRRRRPH